MSPFFCPGEVARKQAGTQRKLLVEIHPAVLIRFSKIRMSLFFTAPTRRHNQADYAQVRCMRGLGRPLDPDVSRALRFGVPRRKDHRELRKDATFLVRYIEAMLQFLRLDNPESDFAVIQRLELEKEGSPRLETFCRQGGGDLFGE